MCGIYCSTLSFSEEVVSKKLERIKFRGPDYTGILRKDDIIFGHNRLSIIDLDERSNQPFVYDTLVIVFNGEIYNFENLRFELVKKGYEFHTNSDTEVLCAMYKEYGIDMLGRLNGMFAFVIYDSVNSILLFSIDRLGQKPLYYSIQDGEIELASQISQLSSFYENEIDEQSVEDFFRYKYVNGSKSIISGVKRLLPGSYGLLDTSTKDLMIDTYWKIPSSSKGDFFEQQESEEVLKGLMLDAVKQRMIADVPLGVFLSGGIDSTLIAAIAQDVSAHPIKTFTISFDDELYDESKYAEEVARILDTDHTTIKCNPNDIKEFINNIGKIYDEPFADPSALPSLLLCQKTSQYVTVALTGDGADELFLGYNRYDVLSKYRSLFQVPLVLRKLASSALRLVPSTTLRNISSLLGERNIGHFYHRFIQPIDQSMFKFSSRGSMETVMNQVFDSNDTLNSISAFDIKTYLPFDINVKMDRASMWSSIETRSPFLDFRVVEFSRSISENQKYDNGIKKRILKEIVYDIVPREVMERKKSGFSVPLEHWFRGELKSWVSDMLTRENLTRIKCLDVERTLEEIESHMHGEKNRATLIWKLLVYISWSKHRDEKGRFLNT